MHAHAKYTSYHFVVLQVCVLISIREAVLVVGVEHLESELHQFHYVLAVGVYESLTCGV